MQEGVFKTISSRDRNITDFKVYKSWDFATSQSLSANNILTLTAIKPNISKYSGNVVTLETHELNNDSASYYTNSNLDNLPCSILYYSLNSLGIEPFQYSSYLSIPQQFIGEGIKAGSINLQVGYVNEYYGNTLKTINLSDDGSGNLVNAFHSSSISNEILYIGFDKQKIEAERELISRSDFEYNNISFVESANGGFSSVLEPDSYLRIKNQDEINTNKPFAIAFWLKRLDDVGFIISKRNTKTANYINSATTLNNTGNVYVPTHQYPFELYFIDSSGRLYFRASNGIDLYLTSALMNVGDTAHIVIQRTSANKLQFYKDKVLIDEFTISGRISNDADIFIGNDNINSGLNCEIDEFFIFNKSLNTTEIAQLYHQPTNTQIVGKILYNEGVVVISDPRHLYNEVIFSNTLNNYSLSKIKSIHLNFNSTMTIHEHEYICKINENEFNFTANKSVVQPDSNLIKDEIIESDNFYPYITTVGLYDSYGRLLAIGKLSNAVKKRNNVDLNIVVRFDV